MTDRPLILFANPVPVAKARRYSGCRPLQGRDIPHQRPEP